MAADHSLIFQYQTHGGVCPCGGVRPPYFLRRILCNINLTCLRQFVLMKHPLFIRAANIAKFGGSAVKVVITKHGGELYVIKHWLMSDVWDFLLSSGADAKYPLPSYIRGGVH